MTQIKLSPEDGSTYCGHITLPSPVLDRAELDDHVGAVLGGPWSHELTDDELMHWAEQCRLQSEYLASVDYSELADSICRVISGRLCGAP
jgi:hypothetical protein